MNIRQLFVDFIPIILVYVFISYPEDAVLLSGSSLGKFAAICIISFYTLVKPIYGVFVCVLVLVYYQTDFVEEILNIERGEWIETRLMEMNSEFAKNYDESLWGNADGRTTIAEIELPKQIPPANSSELRSPEFPRIPSATRQEYFTTPEKRMEGFCLHDPELYSYVPVRSYRSVAEDVIENKDKKTELMAIFRKENCVNEKLMHKGIEVHPEMSDHIFREIKHDDEFNKCNPCISSCSFSIIEEKLRVESELQTPVRSNDIFETYAQSLQDVFTHTSTTISGYMPNINMNFTSFSS
jgi:hypothetical protein